MYGKGSQNTMHIVQRRIGHYEICIQSICFCSTRDAVYARSLLSRECSGRGIRVGEADGGARVLKWATPSPWTRLAMYTPQGISKIP